MKHPLLTLIPGLVTWLPAHADVSMTAPTPNCIVLKRGTTNVVSTCWPDAAACWARAAQDVKVGQAATNYSCVGTSKATLKYVAPPLCPTKPADQVQSAQCPSGTAGTFPQVKTWTSKPQPVCWELATAWSPASAPQGACTATAWVFLGLEDDAVTLTVPSGTVVRYGSGSAWVQQTISTPFKCSNGQFGDPLPGVGKQCERSTGPAPVTGRAVVSWAAPTTNADGTPLTDLVGYRVLWGTAPGTYTNSLPVTALTATFEDLPIGSYYFTVRAVDSVGLESANSVEVTKTVK